MRLSRPLLFVVSCILVVGGSALTWAQLAPTDPRVMSYRGHLENNGAATDGSYDFRFAAFATATADASCLLAATPGTCGLWWEEQSAVNVAAGNFAVLLGASTVLPDAFYAQSQVFLSLAVRRTGDPAFTLLGASQRITPAPFAGRAYGSVDFKVTGTLDVGNQVTVGNRVSVAGGTIVLTDRIVGNNVGGNLHLDPNSGRSDGRIYLNWFSGRGVRVGNGAGATVVDIDSAGNVSMNGNLSVNGNTHGSCFWTDWGCDALYCPNGQFMAGAEQWSDPGNANNWNELCYGAGDYDLAPMRIYCCTL